MPRLLRDHESAMRPAGQEARRARELATDDFVEICDLGRPLVGPWGSSDPPTSHARRRGFPGGPLIRSSWVGRMDQVATSWGATSGATIALMYHALWAVADDLAGADSHYAVALPRFAEQLALCQRLGGGAGSAGDWLSGRAGVILTFDDGHASNHRLGFPVLRAAGAGADF